MVLRVHSTDNNLTQFYFMFAKYFTLFPFLNSVQGIWKIISSSVRTRNDCIRSVQHYIRLTILRFFSSFQLLSVRWIVCRIHTQLKKLVYLTYCILCRLHTLTWMHPFCGTDAQLLYVGCTTFVGQSMNIWRSDAQVL